MRTILVAVMSAAALAVTAPAASATDTWTLAVNSSYKCLDLPSGSTADHVLLQQFGCHDRVNQQWQLVNQGDGYYSIVSVASGKCVDVPSSSTADGVQVQQFTCNNGWNQQWRFVSPNLVVARHSQKCLDVRDASTADHAVVQQFTCHGGANQQWVLGWLHG